MMSSGHRFVIIAMGCNKDVKSCMESHAECFFSFAYECSAQQEAGELKKLYPELSFSVQECDPNITAKAVIALADETGSGRLACKSALEKANGDVSKATELLAKSKL